MSESRKKMWSDLCSHQIENPWYAGCTLGLILDNSRSFPHALKVGHKEAAISFVFLMHCATGSYNVADYPKFLMSTEYQDSLYKDALKRHSSNLEIATHIKGCGDNIARIRRLPLNALESLKAHAESFLRSPDFLERS